MSAVLSIEQREQAGSDSYNRFEYQVHWIVCHIIDKLFDDKECIVFCEFHDDMAEYFPDEECYQFYQIKTKENSSDWTIAEMSKREKNNIGRHKKSFLGFIFYNYLVFGTECSNCHFVSNNDFDNVIKLWQSYIEDNRNVKTEDAELYLKIKERIKEEYSDSLPNSFDDVFDTFIQNTFVHKSDLQLTTYESQTKGMFFEQLEDKNIPINTANLIFYQLVNDVRKKSKKKIKTPVSFTSLTANKGVNISAIKEKVDCRMQQSGNYNDFFLFLQTQVLSPSKIKQLEDAKTLHDSRWLDVSDIKYQECIITIRKVITAYTNLTNTSINMKYLKEQCIRGLKDNNLFSELLDESLIEVLYYEQQFRKGK